MVEELLFQNLEIEHESSINLNNYSWKGSKILTCKIFQHKDVVESNTQEYNLKNDLSKLKANITFFFQPLDIFLIVKKALKNNISIRHQRRLKIKVATKIDTYIK